MNPHRISVTELAREIGRRGNLGRRHFSLLRGVEGIRVHQRMQKDRGEQYQAEVPIQLSREFNGECVEIFGRIDGLDTTVEGLVLEEFKTSRDFQESLPLDHGVHRLQAELYTWMWYQKEGVLPRIRLEYVHPDPQEPTRRVEWRPDADELNRRMETALQCWLKLCLERETWIKNRDTRLRTLKFPFPALRSGQPALMTGVQDAVKSGARLYVQAPTGIGKTIGILLPALQAMGNGCFTTLVIATCRNTGKRIFEEAVESLFAEPPGLRILTLVARERICHETGSPCDCEICPLAKGFYDRLPAGLAELRTHKTWKEKTWQGVAHKHQLCPFAFMMHAAREADVILGDLNYALDPSARLEFLFGKRPESVCLVIDEAHHLPDRARNMISATLDTRMIQDKIKLLPGEMRQVLNPSMQNVTRELRKFQKEGLETDGMPKAEAEIPQALGKACSQAIEALEGSFSAEPIGNNDARLDLYRAFAGFRQSMDNRQASHVCTREDRMFHHLCLDASSWLELRLKPLQSVVIFSGTLLPLDVFMRQTGSTPDDRKLSLASPYESSRFSVELEEGLPLVWKARGPELYDRLTRRIVAELTTRAVKTLVFFPSYALMEEIASRMPKDDLWLGPVWKQPRGLQERDADDFLRPFREEDGPMTGLAVLGGALNEGIDLPGKALESVIVVSIGLPGVSRERELIRGWFNAQGEEGFMMAYTLPGLIRVLQALGRVIRGPEDRGTALLIDPRFNHPVYRKYIDFR